MLELPPTALVNKSRLNIWDSQTSISFMFCKKKCMYKKLQIVFHMFFLWAEYTLTQCIRDLDKLSFTLPTGFTQYPGIFSALDYHWFRFMMQDTHLRAK